MRNLKKWPKIFSIYETTDWDKMVFFKENLLKSNKNALIYRNRT